MSYSVLTSIGGRKENEDRIDIDEEIYPNIKYYGVFDGHGGKEVSEFLRIYLKEILGQELIKTKGKNLKNALENSIKIVNNLVDYKTTGSTCCVALIKNKIEVYIANVGDSRCLVFDGKYAAFTKDHKPGNPEEKKFIEKNGGYVVFRTNDVPRLNGFLALSRAIGDKGLTPALSANADVYNVRISNKTNFLILATDGLWDVLENDEVLNGIYSLRRGGYTLNDINKVLLDTARERGSTDNLTTILLTI